MHICIYINKNIYIYLSCINVYMYVYMHICRDSVGTGPKNSELMHLGDQLADEMSTKTGRRMAESTSCRGRRLSVAWPAQSECLSPTRQAWLLPRLFRCCFALFYRWCRNYRTEVEEYEGTVIYRTLLFYNSVFLGRCEKKSI